MAECKNGSDNKQPSNSDVENPKISELLDRGWKILEEVDSTNEALGSNSIQVKVKRGIAMLEEASRMVAQLSLFSPNEELEEVATADLKYLMLPALLGALTMKQTSREKRLEIVQTARAYFIDFLRRCKEYNASHFELPTSREEDTNHSDDSSESGTSVKVKSVPQSSDLVAMAAQRQAKIERYRQKKELETRLSDVRRAIDSGQADDEVSRDFYLLNVRRWIAVCLEEVESIDQEMEILKKMVFLKDSAPKQPAHPARPPMKPFILTKDAVQASVFGTGYPSLPTMTVDEWYDQHRKHGALPDQGIPRKVTVDKDTDAEEMEEEEKEKNAEQDDEESLMKARNWDDWKDDHRRGYGNRKNMG
ncbi:immunoglobulin-binding protein 1 [Solea senegalensis]|uniref:immunoglobulin-binding protein 1 n=1 Tax=Solea senegalensis TaxID=28829 RepID=UPI001C419A1F|nr:immunoglobulin-binding protein 1 [Solea senegalensis]KAG7518648.1 immunoglobulin-binding protein 1 [Solea senegalensis]